MKNKVEVIAEVGINHNGSRARAEDMILSASLTGADTVKFQLVDPDFYEKDSELYKIFKKCWLSPQKHIILKGLAESVGLKYLCTPQDAKMAKILFEEVGVDRFKIASDGAKDIELLKYIKSTGLPYLISTGMMDTVDIDYLYSVLDPKKATVLHCVSKYPCPNKEANLGRIKELLEYFPKVGYSDHTTSITIPARAVKMGATVIEKHFKENEDCVDASLSLNPKDFKKMVDKIR